MYRTQRLVLATTVLALAFPTPAFASGVSSATFYPHITISLIGLAVAVTLLFQALGVRKVGMGGAIASKISYVILAILCLAASAIAEWAANFAVGITLAQAQLAREVLDIVAMGLLAAYFYSVRRAMQDYLNSMTGHEALLSEQSDTGDADRG